MAPFFVDSFEAFKSLGIFRIVILPKLEQARNNGTKKEGLLLFLLLLCLVLCFVFFKKPSRLFREYRLVVNCSTRFLKNKNDDVDGNSSNNNNNNNTNRHHAKASRTKSLCLLFEPMLLPFEIAVAPFQNWTWEQISSWHVCSLACSASCKDTVVSRTYSASFSS